MSLALTAQTSSAHCSHNNNGAACFGAQLARLAPHPARQLRAQQKSLSQSARRAAPLPAASLRLAYIAADAATTEQVPLHNRTRASLARRHVTGCLPGGRRHACDCLLPAPGLELSFPRFVLQAWPDWLVTAAVVALAAAAACWVERPRGWADGSLLEVRAWPLASLSLQPHADCLHACPHAFRNIPKPKHACTSSRRASMACLSVLARLSLQNRHILQTLVPAHLPVPHNTIRKTSDPVLALAPARAGARVVGARRRARRVLPRQRARRHRAGRLPGPPARARSGAGQGELTRSLRRRTRSLARRVCTYGACMRDHALAVHTTWKRRRVNPKEHRSLQTQAALVQARALPGRGAGRSGRAPWRCWACSLACWASARAL
jgi:hypothetical protein